MATTIIPDIFAGDIGTHFQVEIINLINAEETRDPLDVSLATEILIVFKKPDETEAEFTATFVTDGTDWLVEYVTDSSEDLQLTDPTAVYEQWEYYAWFKYESGERRTSTIKFKLYQGRQSQLGS